MILKLMIFLSIFCLNFIVFAVPVELTSKAQESKRILSKKEFKKILNTENGNLENVKIHPPCHFHHTNFSKNKNLSGLDVSGCTFGNCNFQGCNLSNSLFKNVKQLGYNSKEGHYIYSNLYFNNSNLREAEFSDCYGDQITFIYCNLTNIKFSTSKFKYMFFSNSNLCDLDLSFIKGPLALSIERGNIFNLNTKLPSEMLISSLHNNYDILCEGKSMTVKEFHQLQYPKPIIEAEKSCTPPIPLFFPIRPDDFKQVTELKTSLNALIQILADELSPEGKIKLKQLLEKEKKGAREKKGAST